MLTDQDKQVTENLEPANEMNTEDPMQGIPVWLQPFKVNLEGLEAHVLALFFSERENKRYFKSGDTKTEAQCSCFLPEKAKRDLFYEQESMVVVGFYGMLLLSAWCPKPPGKRDFSKWTKIWEILPGHALIAVRIWEEDILIAEIEELEKLDASEICPRRLNAKEVLITKMEFVFPVVDGSAKLSVRDYEFQETTLRRESTVKRENLSGKSHGDWEEFQP